VRVASASGDADTPQKRPAKDGQARPKKTKLCLRFWSLWTPPRRADENLIPQATGTWRQFEASGCLAKQAVALHCNAHTGGTAWDSSSADPPPRLCRPSEFSLSRRLHLCYRRLCRGAPTTSWRGEVLFPNPDPGYAVRCANLRQVRVGLGGGPGAALHLAHFHALRANAAVAPSSWHGPAPPTRGCRSSLSAPTKQKTPTGHGDAFGLARVVRTRGGVLRGAVAVVHSMECFHPWRSCSWAPPDPLWYRTGRQRLTHPLRGLLPTDLWSLVSQGGTWAAKGLVFGCGFPRATIRPGQSGLIALIAPLLAVWSAISGPGPIASIRQSSRGPGNDSGLLAGLPLPGVGVVNRPGFHASNRRLPHPLSPWVSVWCVFSA